MPLGTALRLFRLVGAECNIHAPADFLKLGNLGAGIFQRVIFRFSNDKHTLRDMQHGVRAFEKIARQRYFMKADDDRRVAPLSFRT